MPRERTFLAIKPDGVQRGHIGEIIARFEKKGFKLVGLKMMVPPMELLEQHYAEHKGKPFYPSLTGFMSSSAVVAMVWEGNNVVAIARKMMGATKPLESAPKHLVPKNGAGPVPVPSSSSIFPGDAPGCLCRTAKAALLILILNPAH